MVECCAVCESVLSEKDGLLSSTGVLVCSEECRDAFVESLPCRGEPQLTVYSRVTGYYTPVSAWNKGKKQEFLDRKRHSRMELIS